MMLINRWLIITLAMLIFSVHHPFMDYLVFQPANYFDVLLIEDEWQTNIEPVKVDFYRRPLHKIFDDLSVNDFRVDKLAEPMPEEIMK